MGQLDKLLIRHIDEMDLLEEGLKEDIDHIYEQINIDSVIEDPEGVFTNIAAAVATLLEEKYYIQASKIGSDFAKAVEKDGHIEIPKTKDQTLNKDLDTESERAK